MSAILVNWRFSGNGCLSLCVLYPDLLFELRCMVNTPRVSPCVLVLEVAAGHILAGLKVVVVVVVVPVLVVSKMGLV